MTITPQNGDLTAGMAGQYSEVVAAPEDSLLTGDLPAHGVTTDETVLADQTLAAFTVVGFDANGKIIPAVQADEVSPIQAIGYLPYAVDSTGADVVASVIRSGCLNPDILVWDSSYDTDAEKAKAFEGAPSPTQIVVRKIQTYTPA